MIPQTAMCLFCLRSDRSFARREHPIPESLGNDDLVLPPGCVCDCCNQYFGTKLEAEVLSLAPFSVSRVIQAVKNKAGTLPVITSEGMTIRSDGIWDGFTIQSDPPHRDLLWTSRNKLLFNPRWVSPNLLVRFLLKMGLELSVYCTEFDVYSSAFDLARKCARYGENVGKWDFGIGNYPDKSALVISRTVDEFGPLEERQIYRYSIGELPSQNVVFCFMYETFYFAVNLTRPPVTEYILQFHRLNDCVMLSRWKAFRERKRK